jgi:hypothetical protein
MSIITAALNPIERYVWGAALVILISFGVYEREHLIHEGEQKIEVAEAAHEKVVAQKDSQIQAAEQKAADQAGIIYEKAVAIAPVGDVGLVCHSTTPAPNRPASTEVGPSNAGSPVEPAEGVFDPSGPILTLLRDDDAQINALIDEVGILQSYIDQISAVK